MSESAARRFDETTWKRRPVLRKVVLVLTYRKRRLLGTPSARRTFGVALGIGTLLPHSRLHRRNHRPRGRFGRPLRPGRRPHRCRHACKGTYDTAHLEDLSNLDATTLTIVKDWSFSAAKTTRWNIVAAPATTHPEPAGTLELKPEVPYLLTAFSRDEETTSASVTFTAADLAGLRPGQVRYFKESESGGTGNHVVVDATEFESLACREIAGLS